MLIKSLHVQNFRNHGDTRLVLSPGINVLVGDNAQGKTNLLEAIYLSCVGRGWRTNRDRDMIKFDAEVARVQTTTSKKFGDVDIQITLSRQNKKAIKINDIPIQKMGELMGMVNCVFFSPDELRLVKEAPADRRRFMDIDISQIDKSYFYALMRYNKILAQRNSLLKSHTEDIPRGLDIWDIELAKVGEVIIQKRINFLQRLKDAVTRTHGHLTDGKEAISLSYESSVFEASSLTQSPSKRQPNPPMNTLHFGDKEENELLKRLQSAREKDMRLRTTTVGPHRDDICITINGKDVRHFASQGQQRTVALSIKLAELEIFSELTGEMPILLLDDVLSELDSNRQAKLLQSIKNCQSIITATDIDANFVNIEIFNIKHGKLLADCST